MEEWYAELSKKNLRGNFAVTGCSLDGHLATAFNLLHPGAAKEVVTFNGAGVGKVATRDVTSAMKIFSDMRSNTTLIDDRLKPSGAALLYRTIKKNLADGTWKVEDALKNAEHALSLERLMNPANGGTDTDLGKDYNEIVTALKDIRDMQSTALRISKLTSGVIGSNGETESPKPVAEKEIDELLFADVNIKNEDVGFVAVGQSAKVKLAAYPFQRHGMLSGTVIHISADASEPSRAEEGGGGSKGQAGGRASYKARIHLDQQALNDSHRKRHHIAPGMQVVVEINQGKRTVLEYLLSPVQKAVS